MASQPGLASSVTSKRNRFQPASAEVISPAMPDWPCQSSSARSMPGAAGWLTHGMLTGTPTTPATAHSTWGLSAGGAECTCRTPRTVTLASLRADEVRLPQRPRLRRRPAQMPGSRDMLPLALLFGLCITTGARRYHLPRVAPLRAPYRTAFPPYRTAACRVSPATYRVSRDRGVVDSWMPARARPTPPPPPGDCPDATSPPCCSSPTCTPCNSTS